MSNCEVSPAQAITEEPTWGWAVVEIRSDGSWGTPRVLPATGPAEAVASATTTPVPGARLLHDLPPLLQAHLGSLHVSNGELHDAALAFTRGAGELAPSSARDDCLGRLAHAEALHGDLRRASRHVGMVRGSRRTTALEHAHLARAWVALQQAEFAETRRRLDAVADTFGTRQEAWLATSRLVAEAQLLTATGQPDAATRLLAEGSEVALPGRTRGWLTDLVTIARAEALLVSGEPQRALGALTPLPAGAVVEATVVAADARLRIGDARGAQAVLSAVVTDLERAPFPVQIQAWLLESRLAADRGDVDRARLVVDRALRCASAEGMRLPLMRDWRWLRGFVHRDTALRRAHRDFLASCQVDSAASPGRRRTEVGSGQLLGACLTEREGQVLDLLAQMYSTEEIAAELYVSSNTVKTHLKGIFGKLCVNRRVEAVRRGRQLGLC